MAATDLVTSVTVKVDAELSDASRALLRALILDILREDLEDGTIIAPFVSTADLKAYVEKQVRKALSDELRIQGMQMRARHERI